MVRISDIQIAVNDALGLINDALLQDDWKTEWKERLKDIRIRLTEIDNILI